MTTRQTAEKSQRIQRRRTISGTVFGRPWSFMLWPRGGAEYEQCDDLPEMVGTDGILLPPQGVYQQKLNYEHVYLSGAVNNQLTCRIRVYSPAYILPQEINQETPGILAPINYHAQDSTIIICEPIRIGGIMNCAEKIATAVWHQLGRPSIMTWIEHWWKTEGSLNQEFLSVAFRVNCNGVLVDPKWHPLSRAQVEQCLGPIEKLSPPYARE